MDQPEKNMNRTHSASHDEIDFSSVVQTIWNGRNFIGAITLALTVLVSVTVFLMPNTYRANGLFAPSQSSGGGALSALAAQYGGLASLAGIDLGGQSSDKTEMGLEVLKSRKFIGDFVRRRDILVPLLAAKRWNIDTGEIEFDNSLYDVQSRKWIRNVRAPKTPMPSLLEAYEKFIQDVLTVNQNRKTGFITISVEHYSPVVAKQWLDWLVEDVNDEVMRQDADEAERSIDYLRKQLELTSSVELRGIFSRLIEDQMKTVVLSKVSKEYLLKTIDPAVIAEEHARPMRFQIIVVTFFLSVVMSVFLVLVLGPDRYYGR